MELNEIEKAAKRACFECKQGFFTLKTSVVCTPNKRCLHQKEAFFLVKTTENCSTIDIFPAKRQQIYPPKTPGMQIFVVKYFYQKALQFNISRHALCAIGEAAYNSNANHLANKKAAALSCAAAFYA